MRSSSSSAGRHGSAHRRRPGSPARPLGDGVRVMNLKDEDLVSAVALVVDTGEEEGASELPGSPDASDGQDDDAASELPDAPDDDAA